MDPRQRIKLEKLLRKHRKSEADLQALNLLNLNSLCCINLRRYNTPFYSSISSLKENTTLLKRTFDELNLDDYSSKSHTPLSSYNRIVRDIPGNMVHHSPVDLLEPQHTSISNIKNNSNENQRVIGKLVKHMNLKVDFLLYENPLNYYITHLIIDCKQKKWRLSKDMPLAKAQLKRFLTVCKFFPPQFELSLAESKSLKHYLLFAHILKFCSDLDLQDSEIVIKIFIILLKMHLINFETPLKDRKPGFSESIFKKILYHACQTETNLQFYISNYFNTIWKFSRNFSVLEAVVEGDKERVLKLLNAGFHIFPGEEQKATGQEFLYISEVIPKTHKMILFVMEKIRVNVLWSENESVVINEEQKKCFRMMWRDMTLAHVSKKELYSSISAEYEHLRSIGEKEELCQNRIRRLRRLVKLYADNFEEMSKEQKTPRSLQDLTKISLRKSFRNINKQKQTTPVSLTVLDMYQNFTIFEDDDFRQPFENYANI